MGSITEEEFQVGAEEIVEMYEDEVGEDENEASPEEPTPIAERDDETNPYWIEDDRLKLGKVGRISILGKFLIQF